MRDYADVRDVVRAYALLLEKGEPGRAYNVCTGDGVPLSEFAGALVREAKVDVELVEESQRLRPLDLPYLVGSPARLTAATGWTPEFSRARTLADLLDAARRAHATPVEGGA